MANDNEADRGPNGFPYIHPDTQVGQWENGEFRMRVIRKDGEVMNVNLNETQFKLLRRTINDLAEKAEVDS